MPSPGINLTEEPTDVADILIDLTQRETRAFSNRFAKTLFNEMKSVARMHKNPLKSAGFKVLKAHDVPSVLIELGYVSNKDDLQHLVSGRLAVENRRFREYRGRRLFRQAGGLGGSFELSPRFATAAAFIELPVIYMMNSVTRIGVRSAMIPARRRFGRTLEYRTRNPGLSLRL